MANTLGLYDPFFYANETLLQLEKALGMARTVHRGYDKTPQQKGSVIKIRRPSVFSAQDMPIDTAQDINPDEVDITLDKWKGVVFALTDKELSFTTEQIIQEHLRPAAYAVADAIDQSLVALIKQVPNFVAANDPAANPASNDFADLKAAMFNLKVPTADRHLQIDGAQEARYLKESLFTAANQSSDGGQTQREGFLGRKFGYDIFANQNITNYVAGAVNVTTGTLQVTVAANRGDTSLTLGATGVTGTIKAGDTFSVAGVTQRFAALADAAFAGNAVVVQLAEPVKVGIAANAAVTMRQVSAVLNGAYHTGAFALAMAPLSMLGDGAGARIATVTDPITGLTLRSRMWYEGKEAKPYIGIDALWGVKLLNGDLAVRLER